ncbi:MAG TPA: matrixin family metalloprotease [Polyangiaceae bacterium]
MLRSVRGCAIALVLLASTWSETSSAFCRTTTCESCSQPAEGCVTEGQQLYWPVSCITYDVQQDASMWTDYAQALASADTAIATWSTVTCPGTGVPPSFEVRNLGPVGCSKHEYNDQEHATGGNANLIVFRDDAWIEKAGSNTLALTTVTFNVNTGELYDADIELNSHLTAAGKTFLSTDTPVPENAFDLPSILTHEVGHFLGLAHSTQVCSADGLDCPTMNSVYRMGSDVFRTLEADDIAGVCAIYAQGRDAADNACTPRHGFSDECGSAAHKGCSTAPIGRRTSGGMMVVAVFGLTLWAARKQRT